ncbi:hypothetical protein Patl1_36909 [Pistacia atlantica]|nr:hypothetical protein Patl1_36909 [Pistacia atlantica]
MLRGRGRGRGRVWYRSLKLHEQRQHLEGTLAVLKGERTWLERCLALLQDANNLRFLKALWSSFNGSLRFYRRGASYGVWMHSQSVDRFLNPRKLNLGPVESSGPRKRNASLAVEGAEHIASVGFPKED